MTSDVVVRHRRAPLHLALGLSPTPRAGLVLVPIGMALGPHGLGVLSNGALAALDPAVSAALAVLGAFIGMSLEPRRRRDGVLLVAGSVEATLTFLVVAGGAIAVDALSAQPANGIPWMMAALLGICAAASATSALPGGEAAQPRIGDFDDVLPIVGGGLALAALRSANATGTLSITAGMVVIAVAIALAAWLLVSRTSSVTEERVFAIGALLLLGGAAAYLSLSALFAGFVAGVVWRLAGVEVCDRITRDLGYLQRPIVALLLLVAGARVDFGIASAGLTALYFVCRIAGKIAGGWCASLGSSSAVPRDLGLALIAPGIVGIAFALNADQMQPAGGVASMLLTIVLAGSILCDFVSLLVHGSDEPA